MKVNNIFDHLAYETTINSDTVTINTGVSAQRVLGLVEKKLDSEISEKIIPINKHGRKTIRIIAIAAAAAVLTAVTAGALGSFGSAFGSLFIGTSPDGIYSGSDLSVTSENTNAEFLGIAGDDTTASAAFRLTKPDGSPFIDDTTDAWISTSATDELGNVFFGATVGEINWTAPLTRLDTLTKETAETPLTNRSDVMGTFGFYFENESSIQAFLYTTAENGGIKGETVTASISNLSAYSTVEVLYDYSEHIADNTDEETGDILNYGFYDAVSTLSEEYGTNAKDGIRLMCNPETHDIVLAKETPLDIDLSFSIKMTYKNSDRKLTSANGGILTVTPFSAVYTANSAPESIAFTLDDGTTVYAYRQDENSDGREIYRFFEINDDGARTHPAAVDPSRVVKAETEGVIFE